MMRTQLSFDNDLPATLQEQAPNRKTTVCEEDHFVTGPHWFYQLGRPSLSKRRVAEALPRLLP
jgi:hypothetical protein